MTATGRKGIASIGAMLKILTRHLSHIFRTQKYKLHDINIKTVLMIYLN